MLRVLGFALLVCAPRLALAGEPSSVADGVDRAQQAQRDQRDQRDQRASPAAIEVVARSSRNAAYLEGATLILRCDCMAEDQLRMTDERGAARFAGLVAGEYTVEILAGKARAQKTMEILASGEQEAEFSVDPERPPGTDYVAAERRPQPQYWGNDDPYGAHTDLHKAGVGLLVAGGAMTTGAVLAATVSVCNRDGASRTNCATDTRTFLAAGFGSAAVALFASGGALVGVAKRRHNLDVAAHASRGRAGVMVSGRF